MQRWFQWIVSARPLVNEFAIFEEEEYCGESFYEIDKEHENTASLDIKLFAFARGRGIATKALLQTIEEAFRNGAEKVWVDPDPQNTKAIALYKRLGFTQKDMPEHLIAQGEDPATNIYMELCKGESTP